MYAIGPLPTWFLIGLAFVPGIYLFAGEPGIALIACYGAYWLITGELGDRLKEGRGAWPYRAKNDNSTTIQHGALRVFHVVLAVGAMITNVVVILFILNDDTLAEYLIIFPYIEIIMVGASLRGDADSHLYADVTRLSDKLWMRFRSMTLPHYNPPLFAQVRLKTKKQNSPIIRSMTGDEFIEKLFGVHAVRELQAISRPATIHEQNSSDEGDEDFDPFAEEGLS